MHHFLKTINTNPKPHTIWTNVHGKTKHLAQKHVISNLNQTLPSDGFLLQTFQRHVEEKFLDGLRNGEQGGKNGLDNLGFLVNHLFTTHSVTALAALASSALDERYCLTED